MCSKEIVLRSLPTLADKDQWPLTHGYGHFHCTYYSLTHCVLELNATFFECLCSFISSHPIVVSAYMLPSSDFRSIQVAMPYSVVNVICIRSLLGEVQWSLFWEIFMWMHTVTVGHERELKRPLLYLCLLLNNGISWENCSLTFNKRCNLYSKPRPP